MRKCKCKQKCSYKKQRNKKRRGGIVLIRKRTRIPAFNFQKRTNTLQRMKRLKASKRIIYNYYRKIR